MRERLEDSRGGLGVWGCGVVRTAQQLRGFRVPEMTPGVLGSPSLAIELDRTLAPTLSLPCPAGEGLWTPGQGECGFPGMEAALGSLASPCLDGISAASPAKWK